MQRLDPAFDFGRQDGAPYAAGGLLLAALLFALLRLGAASGRRRYGPWLLALAVCELLVAAGRTGLWDSLVPAMLASVPWQIHVVEGVLGMLICGLAIDEIFHRGLADLKLPSAIAAAAAVAGLGAAFALSDRAQTPWLEGSAAWGVLALGVLAGTLLALLLSGPARWVACAAVALAAPMLVATNGHARDAPLPRALLRSQALEGAAARVREGDGVHPMIVGGRSLAYVPRAVLEPPDSLRHNGVLRFEALAGRFSKRRGDGSVRRWTVENPIAQRIDLPIFAFPGWVLRVNGRDADLLEPGPNGRLAVELAEGPSELGVAFQGSPLHRGATWLSWIGGLALLAARVAPDAQARGAPSSSSSEAGTR